MAIQATQDIWSLNQQIGSIDTSPILPRFISNALHTIFSIECQLNSDPIHAYFAHFTFNNPDTQDIYTPFNGRLNPDPTTSTFYLLEEIRDPYNSVKIIMDNYRDICTRDKEQNIIIITADPTDWQTSEDARCLPKLKNLHKIMAIKKDTLYLFQADRLGNLVRSKNTYPNDIYIWLLHMPNSTIYN